MLIEKTNFSKSLHLFFYVRKVIEQFAFHLKYLLKKSSHPVQKLKISLFIVLYKGKRVQKGYKLQLIYPFLQQPFPS
jgi:hypothetical protein